MVTKKAPFKALSFLTRGYNLFKSTPFNAPCARRGLKNRTEFVEMIVRLRADCCRPVRPHTNGECLAETSPLAALKDSKRRSREPFTLGISCPRRGRWRLGGRARAKVIRAMRADSGQTLNRLIESGTSRRGLRTSLERRRAVASARWPGMGSARPASIHALAVRSSEMPGPAASFH